ncbi:MAG TPA: methionine synthase, partial [Actinomycetota bacterium]|nr:methionine synthase [Actinomycetota bacterium]
MGEVALPGPGLWTTSVGSLPKPDYITKARSRFARGDLDRDGLRELEKRATREWVEFQDSIGTDVIVDGEQYRGDMVALFAEELPGLEIGGLVRSYGNR